MRSIVNHQVNRTVKAVFDQTTKTAVCLIDAKMTLQYIAVLRLIAFQQRYWFSPWRLFCFSADCCLAGPWRSSPPQSG